MKVDYVIPFVDSSKRDWVEQYRKYAPENCNWSNNTTRFRDWDLLRYQLRSISRHLSWIHRIYIVISVSRAQIPEWLNLENEKIRVVGDWEFFPQEYLPVFNSNVIDLFLPRIEGLAEHYLYACDDYLITNDLSPAEFYSPDYSRHQPQEPTDYRRTLYWNPALRLDNNGQARVILYNNSRTTQVSVSAAGQAADGQLLWNGE